MYQDLIQIDKVGKVRLNIHSGQMAAMTSQARMTFMISGTGGGKTVLGPPWLYQEILRRGAGDYLAVTSNSGLFKLKMLPALLEYFVDILHVGKWWPGMHVIEIMHPTKGFLAKSQHDQMFARIILGSAAAPAALESATAKAAWLDECGQPEFKYEAWEAIQRRVGGKVGRVLGTTTPYNLGWVKTYIFDRWLAGDPTYDVIQFKSTANPNYSQEEYDRAKATLPGWRFEMFYDGNFTKPFGLIYQDFDVNSHGFDYAGFPRSFPRIVGVDFGGANNATIYLAQDPESGIWHAYDEYLEGGLSSKDHVRFAWERLDNIEKRNVRAVGGAPGETQQRLDWKTAGLNVEQPIIGDVEVGISHVIELIKSGKLKISKTLGGLLHEIATYQRVIKDEEITNEILNKSTFHKLDALRYACSLIDKRARKLAGVGGK